MKNSLYPPLEQIQQRLFGISDQLLLKLAYDDMADIPAQVKDAIQSSPEAQTFLADFKQNSITDEAPITRAEPPFFIQDLIKRRCATQHATFAPTPAQGQIVRIDDIKDPKQQLDWQLSSPLAVLLDKPTEASEMIWHGWMVSPDTDYAEYWDILLEPCDEPFDPLAGMIQLWNPVYIWIPQVHTVLGELSLARLQAVRAAATEFLSAQPLDHPAQPGFIAPRPTQHNFSVLTGSPLGHEQDPRHAYQHAYHHIAKAVKEPARIALAQLMPSFVERCRQHLMALLDHAGQPQFEAEELLPQAMGAEKKSSDLPLKVNGYPLYLSLKEHPDCDDMLSITLTYQAREKQGSLTIVFEEEGIAVETQTIDAQQPIWRLEIDPEKKNEFIIHLGEQVLTLPLTL